MSFLRDFEDSGAVAKSARRRQYRQAIRALAARCRPGTYVLTSSDSVNFGCLSTVLQAVAGGPSGAGILPVSVRDGPQAMAAAAVPIKDTFRKGLLAKFGQRLYRTGDRHRQNVQNDVWKRVGHQYWDCFDHSPWADLPQPVRAELRGGVIECLDFFAASALLVEDQMAFRCLLPLILQLTRLVPYGLTPGQKPRWLVFFR